MLNGLRNLTELSLQSNKISYINQEAFIDLRLLKSLNLNENKLSIFNELAEKNFYSPFHHCLQLETLIISKNRIRNFFKDWDESHFLTELNLSYNKLTRLHVNTLFYST